MSENILLKRIVYQIPGMEKVEVHRDLSYSDHHLGMDVYTPPDLPAAMRLPGVVLVHGGPAPKRPESSEPQSRMPTPRTWGVFTSYGELIAASGMVAVMFDHRYYSPEHRPQSAADVAAAIRFARERAEDFHLDPDRLAVWAFSGGGVFLNPVLRDRPAHVRCLVAYYPVLDLEEGVGSAGDGRVHPPLFLARAGRDSNPGLNQGVDRFVQEALAANAPIELINHPEGQHGFDLLDDDLRSRTIIARTIDFLKANL